MRSIARVAFLVRDYDEAIQFFTKRMDFKLMEDNALDANKRWVVVAPSVSEGAELLLAKADSETQAWHIGNQAGGRVFLFLTTDDFHRDYESYRSRGIEFVEGPREEPYGTVAVFLDLYGNRWDLIQPDHRH